MNNQQINTFEGGMNMDLDNNKLSPNQYPFAENFRHTVSSSNSLGGLEAMFGNKFLQNPNIPGCIRYSIRGKSNVDTLIDLRIKATNGHVLDFTLTESDHTIDESKILSIISTHVTTIIATAESDIANPIQAGSIKYLFDGNSFVIYGDIKEITTFTNNNPSVYCSFHSENSEILYYNGYTEIRDKTLIYVITKNLDNAIVLCEETTDLSNVSVIFDCKYVGNLNFNLDYPIIDSAINYENSLFCKVYFTDNYNSLKHVNIFYPTLMAKEESFFDLISNVSLGNIKISNIYQISSEHKCGRIQYAFQYYNENGQESTFSNLSNMVDLTTGNFNGAWNNYIGGDINEDANKQVKIKLWNLDRSFENFRIISVFYSGKNSEAVIKIIYEDKIPQTGEFEYVDANLTGETITSDELLYAGTKLLICKTLDVKNNLLLIANIKDKYEDYTNIDTRAYRFNAANDSSSAKLFDTNEIIFNYLDFETTDIPLTADCKLPKIEQFAYRYGKNKETNTWMLGGSGKMISYNFVRFPVNSGNKSGTGPNSGSVPLEIYLGDQYPNDTLYNDLSSPIKSGVLAGYMRNEVYRFGIEFYDTKGRKSFVNWIGDIKFPAISEIDTTYITIDGTDIYDYRTSYTDQYGSMWMITLGIEFHIDTLQLPVNISGYSIVRMERSQSDKTEIAQGLFSGDIQDTKYGPIGAYTPKISYYIPFSKNGDVALNGINGTLYNLESGLAKEFITPEISYNVIDNTDVSGKDMKIVGTLVDKSGVIKVGGNSYEIWPNMNIFDNLYITKPMHSRLRPNQIEPIPLYIDNLTNLSKNITDSIIIDPTTSEAETSFNIGNTIVNCGTQIVYGPTGVTQTGTVTYKGVIGKGLFLKTETFPVSTLFSLIGNPTSTLLLANISSDDTIQYGGNTFYARSNNEYISCNHVRSTKSVTGILSDIIFGGDTFVCRYTHVRTQPRAGDWETTVLYDSHAFRTHYSEFISFPVETSINTNIGNSNRMKSKLAEYNNCVTKAGSYNVYTQGLDGITLPLSTDTYIVDKDSYVYNTVFSRTSGVMKFQAKPLNLNENQIFDSRILSSRRKYNGESTDNWLIFDPTEFIDLQNKYGPINKLVNFGNQIMCLQDSAIGIASVDEKAITQDVNSPGNIILGTGGILKRYDYISTSSGTRHQASVLRTPTALYYHDSINSKAMIFSGQENSLSESKGIQSLLNKYKSLSVVNNINDIKRNVIYSFNNRYREVEMFYILDVKGIIHINGDEQTCTVAVSSFIQQLINLGLLYEYDILLQTVNGSFIPIKIINVTGSDRIFRFELAEIPSGVSENDSVILKFGKSIIYNELAGAFSGFVTRYPYLKININNNSYDVLEMPLSHYLYKNDDPYETCLFYGNTYNPKISYVVNQDIQNSKVFDAISIASDVTYLNKNSTFLKNPIKKLRCHNTHYNSGWMNGVDYGYTFGNRNEVMVRKFEDRWSIPIPRNACKYTPTEIIDNKIDILDDDTVINYNRKFREKIDGKYVVIDMVFNTFKTSSIKRISLKLVDIITGFRTRF